MAGDQGAECGVVVRAGWVVVGSTRFGEMVRSGLGSVPRALLVPEVPLPHPPQPTGFILRKPYTHRGDATAPNRGGTPPRPPTHTSPSRAQTLSASADLFLKDFGYVQSALRRENGQRPADRHEHGMDTGDEVQQRQGHEEIE